MCYGAEKGVEHYRVYGETWGKGPWGDVSGATVMCHVPPLPHQLPPKGWGYRDKGRGHKGVGREDVGHWEP